MEAFKLPAAKSNGIVPESEKPTIRPVVPPQPARPSSGSRLQRERWHYPDSPVGLKLGGKLLDMEEVVTIKAVAAPARRRRFRLGPPQDRFYPGQPKQELAGLVDQLGFFP